MQRHGHQEFIRVLTAVEGEVPTGKAEVPAGKVIHAILDNDATHEHPKVVAWLERHPRRVFHFTQSASWTNAVETFFSALTRRSLRRGVFRSVVDLQAAIERHLADHDHHPGPFVWTEDASGIGTRLARADQALASVH